MANHPEKKNRKFLYISVFITNLVAFTTGIQTGWSSPVIAHLTSETKITENPLGVVITNDEASWISSCTMLGAFSGPILTGFLITKLGPKKTLLSCCGALFIISFLMTAFAKTIILYYIARYIGGIGLGALFSVLPHYLSEISEDSIRGKVSSSMSVFLMSGTLYAFIVGPYLSIMWFNISCAIWPALFFALFLIFVPESPYYLIASNDPSGAIESLKKFRSTSESNVMNEIEIISNAVEQDKKNIGTFKDVFKSKATIKALVITLSLMVFQQFSGINAVLFNAETIFSATGSDISPDISTIIIGAIQLAASFMTPLVVDRGGRKLLLLVSATGMLTAEIPLGLYFYLKDTGKDVSNISWLPIMCLIVYITFYNFGFGTVPWTVMAEVFPTNIKATAATLSVCFSAVLAFIVTKFFPTLNAAVGMGGTFWLFSAFCAIAIPFVIFYMFETKGKSFQEIQSLLATKKINKFGRTLQ